MKFSDMQVWVTSQLGETLSTNPAADPRFFSLQEFVLWLNLYRKEFNEDAKLLIQSSSVTTVKNQATYAWTAFSPIISQPVDYLRFTYTTTQGGTSMTTPMNFVDKNFLDSLFPDWSNPVTGPQTAVVSPGQYIYLNTHNVFGVQGIPADSVSSISVDWVFPPNDYSIGSSPDLTSQFPDDLMDRIPLFAVLATAFKKRGRVQEAGAAEQEYQAQRAKKIGHIRYDQTAKPRNFQSFTVLQRKTYRNAY